MKKAFTMLELVIVIVILGIVASIGSEIFAAVFDNYVKTRSAQSLQIQSQIAMEQIAKRLSYRIDYTLAAYENSTIKLVENSSSDEDKNVDLVWHARDYAPNRLEYSQKPAYTGYAYCDETTNPMVCYSKGGSSLANYDGNGFLMFNADWYQTDDESLKNAFYSGKQPICKDKENCEVKFENEQIAITNGNSSFKTAGGYQISTQINRLAVEGKNLYLYTCAADAFSACTNSKSASKYLLARNVGAFRFKTLTSSIGGGTYGIMLKICVEDPTFTYDDANGQAQPYAVCKTQVVE